MTSDRSKSFRITKVQKRDAAKAATDADAPKPLPAFASKANDLDAIRKAVDDAAAVSGALWLSYLFTFFYFAVAAGAVTHVDMLLERPVKLPFLNIDLPLLAFFSLAPILFVIAHAYTLVHFAMLSRKATNYHRALYETFPSRFEKPELSEDEERANTADREARRRLLPSNIFVQFLAGPSDVRETGFGRLLMFIAWTTLVFAPILLLLLLQVQFLPYHSQPITWIARVMTVADLLFIWWLWRKVIVDDRRQPNQLMSRRWKALVLGVPSTLGAVFLSWTVVTFPGEHMNNRQTWPTLHEWLLAGDVDELTRRRKSWWSNTLVLPGLNIYQVQKLDEPSKLRFHTVDLRGRNFEGIVLSGAILGAADLSGANLRDAYLSKIDLQGATLTGARLEDVSLTDANLNGADLTEAVLDGADLTRISLIGAIMDQADLRASDLTDAKLHAASVKEADLSVALLTRVRAFAADFGGATLRGASFDNAELLGANLERTSINAVTFDEAYAWRTRWKSAYAENILANHIEWDAIVAQVNDDDKDDAQIRWNAQKFEILRKEIDLNVPSRQLRTAAFKRIFSLDCLVQNIEFISCSGEKEIGPKNSDLEDIQCLEKKYCKIVDVDRHESAFKEIIINILCKKEKNRYIIFKSLLDRNILIKAGSKMSKLYDELIKPECGIIQISSDEMLNRLDAIRDASTR